MRMILIESGLIDKVNFWRVEMKLIKEYRITLLLMINVVLVIAILHTGNLWFDFSTLNIGIWLIGKVANAEEKYQTGGSDDNNTKERPF